MSNPQLDPGEQTATANGLTLCYQTFGNSAHPALLLIMGLGAQMIWWDEGFCEALAARGFYVVRFDNRDIGKSTWMSAPPPDPRAVFLDPKLAPYNLSDMARDAVGLMDALRIARAHLVGASMGGMIAQTVAIEHPERVLTLTSIMSTTGEPGIPTPQKEVWAALTAPPPTTVEGFIEAHVNVSRLMRGYDDVSEAANDRSRAIRAAGRGLNPPGGIRQTAAIFASGSRKEALGKLAAPTLVIHGIDDPLISVEGGRATARAIRGAKLLELDRMGHMTPRAHWAAIIDAIAEHAGLPPQAGN